MTILEFLKQRPLIKILALEKEANIPEGMIAKALKGKQPLPKKYEKALSALLKKYGYKTNLPENQ